MNRIRSIQAVFRVQCGKCRGWLSLTPSYRPGTDIRPEHQTVMLTAERACNWPGEGAARRGALAAGWTTDHTQPRGSGVLLCPTCTANPLGILLSDPCPNCLHVHRLGSLCGCPSAGYPCLCTNQEKRD